MIRKGWKMWETFRNKDVKRQILWSAILTLAGTGLAFVTCRQEVWITCIVCCALSGVYLVLTFKRYKEVRRLADDLDAILHREVGLTEKAGNMQHFREGDLEVLRDEIEKLLLQLQQKTELLQEDRGRLSAALADISHQIRTPLTSLNLQAERLRSRELPDQERRKLVRDMSEMLSRIGWLVDTLLKLSRLDAGTAEFTEEEICVEKLVKEALLPFELVMELHGQTCILDLEKEIRIRGDYIWILEAVQNVVKNALEHTPDGGRIWIQSEKTPLYTALRITDSGEGIREKDLPHLFERFYKGAHSVPGNFGIGLALAKAILKQEEAVIRAGNSREHGGEFTIRFYR